MKKSVVALLLALAVIVLISPGIVGRLAERSMDENLDWAADESNTVVVTSTGFDRGWFSSAGTHRVEIRPGRLHDLLLVAAGADASSEAPALIIDTHLDHGLIPVASMARDKGSLAPGLGSAVSTLTFEMPDGRMVPVPGTIYSRVGLTGELHSNYVLPAGSRDDGDDAASWGDVDINVTTSPASGAIAFAGTIESLVLDARPDGLHLADIEFSGDQRPTPFGFRVGPVSGSIGAVEIGSAYRGTVGPVHFDSTSSVEGDRVFVRQRIEVQGAPGGVDSVGIDLRLEKLDGAALGALRRLIDDPGAGVDPDALALEAETRSLRLLARGLELHVDRLNLAVPGGRITGEMHVVVAASDPDAVSWPSLLLKLEADADLHVPATVADPLMASSPELAGAVGLGFLQKNGDVYELHAQFRKGRLTVNGAPLPIPWSEPN